jgi:hypothetical protein
MFHRTMIPLLAVGTGSNRSLALAVRCAAIVFNNRKQSGERSDPLVWIFSALASVRVG